MARGSGVKKLFTATRKIGSAEPVAAGETGGRHPARGAARDPPRRQIGFGSRAAAVAAHRPAQPLGEDEADRVGQAAVAIALQHHALSARSEEHTSELQALMRNS